MKYEDEIYFQGRDWILVKAHLEELKKTKVGLLIGADTHEKSERIRGALSVIDQLLALENAANRAAN